MNETLFKAYFVIWFALAIGAFLFFRGREPAFKRRWYRLVLGLSTAVIGGMIVVMVVPFGPAVVATSAVVAVYFVWVTVYLTRVCLGCGKFIQPRNLITPEKFCSKCGTALDSTTPASSTRS